MKNKYIQVLLIYILIYIIAIIYTGNYDFRLWDSDIRNNVSVVMIITFIIKI